MLNFIIKCFWHITYMVIFVTRVALIYLYLIKPYDFSMIERIVLLSLGFAASPETIIWTAVTKMRLKYDHNWWWAPFYDKNQIDIKWTSEINQHLKDIKYCYCSEHGTTFFDLLHQQQINSGVWRIVFLRQSDLIEFKLKFV